MERQKKILSIPLKISLCLVLVGFIFKILQWPFASAILTIAFTSIFSLYAVRFWNKSEKSFMAYNKLILISFWTINGLIQIFDLPFAIYTQFVLVLSMILWAILEGTTYFSNENKNKKLNASGIIWNICMVLGSVAVILGGLLMLMDWDHDITLLTIGVFLITLYVFKDVFVKEYREEEKL